MPVLHYTKVVHVHESLDTSPNAEYSIGQLIDMRIEKAMESGDELGQVEVVFEPDEWRRFASSIMNAKHGISDVGYPVAEPYATLDRPTKRK